MKRFRRNAEFVPDSLCFEPIDRNQRVRAVLAAEALERRTKAKGQKSGVLKQSGLRVQRCLLYDFCSVPGGRCDPSYAAIREKTGYCEATIAGALKRLEASGLLRITRRIIRTPQGARQTSNAYSFSGLGRGERKPDFTNSRATPNLQKNNQQPAIPGLMPIGDYLPKTDFRGRQVTISAERVIGPPTRLAQLCGAEDGLR